MVKVGTAEVVRTRMVGWGAGLAALVLVVLAVPLAVRQQRPLPGGTVVKVHLDDFHVHPDQSVVPAGMVRFRLGNNGPSTHEFILVRSEAAPDKLPLQRDGLTVDEEGPGLEHIDEVEGLDIADRSTLAVSLSAGHYVLFCNMEGHYLGGMHAAFTVR
jgi:uncharacterized cupredoxin-like copper-binding protein